MSDLLELPPVLDACCGSRMFWFDKCDPRALFVDIRSETVQADKRRGVRPNKICPDMIADFTKLPFADGAFSLVVFDPPHLTERSRGGYMAQKYGLLPMDWKNYISRGFCECFRVLKPSGTLVFKWSETRIAVSRIIALAPYPPLFGNRYGRQAKSHWIVFLRP